VEAEEKVSFWQRPLRTVVWASLLGAAILISAIVVANGLRHDYQSESSIVILTQRRTQVYAGDPFPMVLRLETMHLGKRQSDDTLRNVRLRLSTKTFRRFQLIDIKPPPDETYEVGRANYYSYRELKRGAQITLTLRALRVGRQQLTARVYSDNQTSDSVNVDVRVRPAKLLRNRLSRY
jgi:hypothetical protein